MSILLPVAASARSDTVPSAPLDSESEDAGQTLVVSADEQLAFARTYLGAGRFADAVRELERFLHFFPDDPRIPEVRDAVGRAWLRAGKPETAVPVFRNLAADVGDGPLSLSDPAVRAHFGLARAYARMGEPGQAITALQNLVALTENPGIRDAAFYRMGWIYLEAEAWRPAQLAFVNIRPESREPYRVPELFEAMQAYPDLPRKRPALAGALAAVPGAGYLYLGRGQDALVAFLLNGALGLAAWEAFEDGNEALGGLLSAVGFGFYSGSIYGSIAGAHKFNRDRTRNFLDRVKDRVGVSLSRGPDGDARVGVGISGEF